MLSAEQIAEFHRNGYLRVPGILNAKQVKWLRSFLEGKFALAPDQRYAGDTDEYLYDIYARYPELSWLLFLEPTVKILKSLLGEDFVVLRESIVQLNRFGGWHKDTTSQEKAGNTFHWNHDFLMIEAAYYLQDNTKELGGGLDVEPRSHTRPDPFIGGSKLKRLMAKVQAFPVSIPSKAGDLVLFHFRINHRATQAREVRSISEGGKLAIFTACSRNNSHVHDYLKFLATRPEYAYLKASYPDAVIKQAHSLGLTLV